MFLIDNFSEEFVIIISFSFNLSIINFALNKLNTEKNSIIIKFPKWMNENCINLFLEYLKNGDIKDYKDINNLFLESTMQKLLWIGDYFQMDDLQEKTIKFCILPRLKKENCLMFLAEALKKIKYSQNISDIWNELLKFSLILTAKNFNFLLQNNYLELLKLDNAILEEIIERYIIYEKRLNNMQSKEIIDFLMDIYKTNDIFKLFNIKSKPYFASCIFFSKKSFFY